MFFSFVYPKKCLGEFNNHNVIYYIIELYTSYKNILIVQDLWVPFYLFAGQGFEKTMYIFQSLENSK